MLAKYPMALPYRVAFVLSGLVRGGSKFGGWLSSGAVGTPIWLPSRNSDS